MNTIRYILPLLVATLLSSCASHTPTPKPEGYVQSGTWVVREDQVMRVAAGASGRGTLIYQGWQYNFTFTDAKITMTGNVGGDIEGYVYNLETLKDFEGTYDPKPEYNEAKHLTGLWARNSKGVTLHVDRLGQDITINLEAKGATVTLVD